MSDQPPAQPSNDGSSKKPIRRRRKKYRAPNPPVPRKDAESLSKKNNEAEPSTAAGTAQSPNSSSLNKPAPSQTSKKKPQSPRKRDVVQPTLSPKKGRFSDSPQIPGTAKGKVQSPDTTCPVIPGPSETVPTRSILKKVQFASPPEETQPPQSGDVVESVLTSKRVRFSDTLDNPEPSGSTLEDPRPSSSENVQSDVAKEQNKETPAEFSTQESSSESASKSPPKSSSKSSLEPASESNSKPPPESPTKPISDSPPESPPKTSTVLLSESLPEPLSGPAPESPPESLPLSPTKSPSESVAEPSSELLPESLPEPLFEPAPKPPAESLPKPFSGPAPEPSLESLPQSLPKLPSEPLSGSPPEPPPELLPQTPQEPPANDFPPAGVEEDFKYNSFGDRFSNDWLRPKTRGMFRRVIKLKTHMERLEFIYQHQWVDSNVFYDLQKNDRFAVHLEEVGTKCLKQHKYWQALRYYTESLAFARKPEILAKIYDSRSFCLMSMGLFEDCILDVVRALKLSTQLRRSSEDLIERRYQARRLVFEHRQPPYHQPIPKILGSDENVRIHGASSAVQKITNDEYGSHYVATRDIRVGEVIMVEPPIVSALDYTDSQYHCDYCMEICNSLVPCDYCTIQLYCGLQCKRIAYVQYHRYECNILPTLDKMNIHRSCILGMRLVFMSKWERENPFPAIREDTRYRSDRLKEIRELKGDMDYLTGTELYERCAILAIIYMLVKKHTNFIESPEEDLDFKEQLLTLSSITFNNQQAIGEYTMTTFDSPLLKPSPFGTGLFSVTSLINHSCTPNVSEFFYGNHIVVKAMRDIHKDEECCFSYGPIYFTVEKDVRQIDLDTLYHFLCRCRACDGEWPTLEYLPVKIDLKPFLKRLYERLRRDPTLQLASTHVGEVEASMKEHDRSEPSKNYAAVYKLLRCCYMICGNLRPVRLDYS